MPYQTHMLAPSRFALIAAIALMAVGACSAQNNKTPEAKPPQPVSAVPAESSAESDVVGEPASSGASSQGAHEGAQFVVGQVSVPDGFSITLFHEGVGDTARHLAVRDNGDIFVAMRDGRLVAVRDTDGDGVADDRAERDLAITTEVEVRGAWLYFSDRVSVSRVKLDDGLMPSADPEIVVDGFARQNQHAEKTIAFDDAGNLYVNIGAPSNACQEEMRTPGSPGLRPCPQLDQQAGVWKFPADTIGMKADESVRYITGARNAMAMDYSAENDGFFVAVHGRDQLHTLFPDLYTNEQSAELPAEEIHLAREGADLGWPYTYFDPIQKKRFVAPEYGGDGKAIADEGYHSPVAVAPAHWAPNDLRVIRNERFPAPFNEGVVIAFHGSWNRAPLPQAGFRLSFLPTVMGQPAGGLIDFAVGFPKKEMITSPSDAAHRPMGVAMGPDGALYVSDSAQGAIFKIAADTQ